MSPGTGRGRRPGASRPVGPGAGSDRPRAGRPVSRSGPDPADGPAGPTDARAAGLSGAEARRAGSGRGDGGRPARPGVGGGRVGGGQGGTSARSATGGGARRWRLVRAGHDAVPPSARRFMRRARRRRLRAALPWAVGAGVLGLLALASWIVLGTGVLGVRQVRVTGAELVTPAEVRAAAAVPNGAPLARVDLAEVRRRIGRLAPVSRVTVHRSWPGTLVVEIVERTPVLAVPQGDRFGVLDGSGVVFQTVPTRPADLPLARIASPGPADLTTRAAVAVFGSLTPELRQRLGELVADGPAGIKLVLRDGRTVIWGDASLGDAKARVATSLLSRAGTTIDVSAPDVVTIR